MSKLSGLDALFKTYPFLKIAIPVLICVIVVGAVIGIAVLGGNDNSHTHSYGTSWSANEDEHWHECSCGDKIDKAAHELGLGTITTEPQLGVPGVRTFTCSICEKTTTEPIDALTKPATSINGMDSVSLDKTYDGTTVVAPTTLTTTNTDPEVAITFEWYKGTTKIDAPKDAGTYTLRAKTLETTNFSATEKDMQFTIKPVTVTLTWSAPANLEYDNTEKLASAVIASGPVGSDTVEINIAGENNIKPGTAVFTATTKNENYVISNYEQGYIIKAKALSNVNIVKQYDGTTTHVVKLTTEHGVYEGDEIWLSVNTGDHPLWTTSRNDWTISHPSFAIPSGNNAMYYTIAKEDVTVQVVPKEITLPATLSLPYTGSTILGYNLTLADGIVEDEVGLATVYLTVADPNVSAGEQQSTITKSIIVVDNWENYIIVGDLPKITIVAKPVYSTPIDVMVEYNGKTSIDFKVPAGNGEYLYLTGDVENENVGIDKALSNIRLTEGRALPSNYGGIDDNLTGTIDIYPKEITVNYTVTYTGSTITIPTLTPDNATFEGMIAGDTLSVTGVVLKDSNSSDTFWQDDEEKYMTKELTNGGTLSGADAGNYKMYTNSAWVYITPNILSTVNLTIAEPVIGANVSLYPQGNISGNGAVTVKWYSYVDGGKGEEITTDAYAKFESGKQYYAEILVNYRGTNYGVTPETAVTMNGSSANICVSHLSRIEISHVFTCTKESEGVPSGTLNVLIDAPVAGGARDYDLVYENTQFWVTVNGWYEVNDGKESFINGDSTATFESGKTYRVKLTVTGGYGYDLRVPAGYTFTINGKAATISMYMGDTAAPMMVVGYIDFTVS